MNTRTKITLILAGALLLWPLSGGALYGQEEEREETKDEGAKEKGEGLSPDFDGQVRGRGVVHSDLDHAAKFLEYRDIRQGGMLDLLEFGNTRRSQDDYYFKVAGRDVAEADQQVDIEVGHYGFYDLNVTWNRIPHRFGAEGSTLYRGIGSGVLTIDDTVQSDVQTVSPAANQNTGATTAALGRHLDESQHLGWDEVMLQRDRIDGHLVWYNFEPVRLTIDVDFERRNGVRPMGASFSGNSVQVLEPIDYQTFNIRGAASYATGPFDSELYYKYGYFNTGEEDLIFDNPLRLTNRPPTRVSATTFESSIPYRGRLALDSDNQAHEFGLKAGYQITERMRVAGRAAWGIMTSSIELLPYTINDSIRRGAPNSTTTIVPFEPADPASLPEGTFDGQAVNHTYDLALTGQPMDPFEYKLYGNYYVWNDEREQMDFPGESIADTGWTGLSANRTTTRITQSQLTIKNHHTDHSKGVAGLKTTFHLPWALSKLKPEYQFKVMRQDNREVERVTENAVGLDLETNWNEYLTTEIGSGYSWRDATHLKAIYDQPLRWNPRFRQFDISDRNRYEFHLGATVTPVDFFEVSPEYRFQHDDFDAWLGVREMEWQEFTLSTMVNPDADVDVNVYYTLDRYDTKMQSRQYSRGFANVSDPQTNPIGIYPDSDSNWSANIEERIHTVGFRPTWRFLPQWSISSGYAFNWSETRIDFESRNAGTAIDVNAFDPWDIRKADDTHRHTLNAELQYEQSDWLEFYGGYTYDFYAQNNARYRRNYNIAYNAYATGNPYIGHYGLGDLGYDNDEVHVGYLGLGIRF